MTPTPTPTAAPGPSPGPAPAATDEGPHTCTVRVVLPAQLRRLARVDGELALDVAGPPVHLGAVLDAVEERHPVLRGAIRDHGTGARRAFVRFFACEEDLSHSAPGTALPPAVARGDEPLLVVGAMAGG